MPTKTAPTTLPKPISLRNSIGPSFIMLGLALGSGELILWPYLAANWGLGLLWGALLGISFQYVLNTEVMRYSLAWGESVFVGFKKLSILIPIWYIISTFIPWSLPGFSSASSEIMTTLVPSLPETGLAIGFLLITGLMLSAGKTVYKTMETFQKSVVILGLPFLFIVTLLMTNHMDWIQAAWGMVGKGNGWWFFPQGVALASFLGAFAYSGAGGNLNLAQSYYIKEKGFGMGAYSQKLASLFSGKSQAIELEGTQFKDSNLNQVRWEGWWKLVTREHFLVFWGLGFITIVILSVLASATVYGTQVEEGLSFLYAEATSIAAVTHPVVGTFFLLVAALMLFSTQVGVLESSSRIISENVLLLFYKKHKKMNLSKAFYVALWGQISLGIIIYMVGIQEPRFLLTLGAVLNAAAMMMSFILIGILNKKKLSQRYQAPFWRRAVMFVAVCFFAYFLALTLQNFSI